MVWELRSKCLRFLREGLKEGRERGRVAGVLVCWCFGQRGLTLDVWLRDPVLNVWRQRGSNIVVALIGDRSECACKFIRRNLV